MRLNPRELWLLALKQNWHRPKSFSTRLVIGLLIFFVILSFLFSQHSELDECLSNPCLNGVCLDRSDMYACECDDGYIGPHCDIEVNECHSHPFCGNGTCVDDWLSYTCSCNYGFTGSDCSIRLSDGGRCTKRRCCHMFFSKFYNISLASFVSTIDVRKAVWSFLVFFFQAHAGIQKFIALAR